jgi:polyvinyl alcohol dehydrogenase (cytochrome)
VTRANRPVLFFSLAILATSSAASAQDGATLFKTHCASCHEPAAAGAPPREVLRGMRAEQILQALEKGSMQRQAAERSRVQRRALSEYLSGKPLPAGAVDSLPTSAFCDAREGSLGSGPAPLTGPAWNGWGSGLTNRRFQPAQAAGITADLVPHLKLRWAFGFRGASSAGTQPVVAGGRVYVGTAEGEVYALDAKTGCVYWTLETEAGVRSAITIDQRDGGLTAYFGDQSAHVYAVDARSGTVRWRVKVDEHPRAGITGAPQLYNNRLYVPVSSREESQVGDPRYPCCEFRGSVVALDAATGKVAWKTYTVAQQPAPTQKNSVGIQLFGPSGAAVWNAPTIDARRNMLYVGTGNNYSPPATDASDSVVAFDLATGQIRWIHQVTENDIWNASCMRPNRELAVCPDKDAPDFDFPGSPILVDVADGRQLIVAGSKSGVLFALDPDNRGKTVWQRRVATGSTLGGIFWGAAADAANVYAPDGDFDATNPERSGGISAVELNTGRLVWSVRGAGCVNKSPCKPSQVAAVTVVPGAAFSGTLDGRLRAYSTHDGKVIWEYDTAREFATVNGVKANGGSISNGGPAVVDGMLLVNSGYSHHGGILPGNVLLAFSAHEGDSR